MKLFLLIVCLFILFPDSTRDLHAQEAVSYSPYSYSHLRSYLVIDESNEKILLHKNVSRPYPIASLTKLAVALTALSQTKPDKKIIVMIDQKTIRGNKIGMENGEVFTLHNLLILLLVQSANDVAYAIAIGTSGSVSDFVREMNLFAKKNKLSSTKFRDPSGFSEKNISSARDLSVLWKLATKHPLLNKILTDHPDFVNTEKGRKIPVKSTLQALKNTRLMPIRGKTGQTRAAGYCFAGQMLIQGKKIQVVTLGAKMAFQELTILKKDLEEIIAKEK